MLVETTSFWTGISALLACAAVNVLIGFVWYTPLVMGSPFAWRIYSRRPIKQPNFFSYAVTVLGPIVGALILKTFIVAAGVKTLPQAMFAGFLAWGLGLSLEGPSATWIGADFVRFSIDKLGHLIQLVSFGAILHLMD